MSARVQVTDNGNQRVEGGQKHIRHSTLHLLAVDGDLPVLLLSVLLFLKEGMHVNYLLFFWPLLFVR